ncbi:MAG: flippase activity-associated protein Agl23 [Salinigranum sp.]
MSTDDGTDRSRTFLALLAIAALALVVRLVGLGVRIFHWDEGRVGYWILRYHETGTYFYRPIVHGPFLPIVNNYLFSVVPVSDFAARLPVAVVGGLLPLAAWLFRDRLRDDEVVAFALLLALNPLMVYYSRFMRSDVLVAAFSLFALGFFVRTIDGGDLRNLYAAAAAMALAFASKENALLYLLCWIGAGVLLVDHRLLWASARDRPPRTVAFGDWPAAAAAWTREHGTSLRDGVYEVGAHVAGAFVVFFVVVVFFYAPRPEFWHAFAHPGTFPSVVHDATFTQAGKFYDSWVGGSHQNHDYFPYLYDYLETLAYGAPVVLVFSVIGFLVDRYGGTAHRFRELVTLSVYWGVVSIAGYPIATDIQAPWTTVHAVVPLSIPAAVGLAYVYREGRAAVSVDDAAGGVLAAISIEDVVGVGLTAVVLLAAAGSVVGANAMYMNAAGENHKQVLQWAQPSNDLKSTLREVRTVAEANGGTDVLYYGTKKPGSDETLFYVQDEHSLDTPPPGGPAWHSRLPLPWYLERDGAKVTSTPPDESPAKALSNPPPIVIAYGFDEQKVSPYLDGYTAHRHHFKLWGEDVVIFIEDSALARARAGPNS